DLPPLYLENTTATMILPRQSSFRTPDGLELFAQTWFPEMCPRAVVALVHGFVEHSGRYAHVGERLASEGIVLAAFDLRGHGRSPGKRAYVPTLEVYHDDVASFLEIIRARHPGVPIFLMGHSLGGLIAVDFVRARTPAIDGLILSAPLLGVGTAVSRTERWIATYLGRWLPWLPLPVPFHGEAVSRD